MLRADWAVSLGKVMPLSLKPSLLVPEASKDLQAPSGDIMLRRRSRRRSAQPRHTESCVQQACSFGDPLIGVFTAACTHWLALAACRKLEPCVSITQVTDVEADMHTRQT